MTRHTSGVRMGYAELLTLALVILKLSGCITWSWWWVIAPLWGPPALLLAFLLILRMIDAIDA